MGILNFRRWVSILILVVSVAFAQGETGDMTVESFGSGISSTAALNDAKRNAVEQGIGSLLISQTEIENFSLKKDYILTQTVGAVNKYDILSESQQADGMFAVKIRAVVSTRSIKQDLVAMKILLESMDKPRLMVIIDEPDQPTVETALINYLRDKGFELVDKRMTAKAIKSAKTSPESLANTGDEIAAQVGQQGGAEYILLGKASKKSGPGAFGMMSGQVALSVRIVNCSTAKIIASKSGTASFAHMDGSMAVAMASERVANTVIDNSLFEQLISSFQDMANNGTPLDVVVHNVTDYKMQKMICTKIEELPGTVSATKRGFSAGELSISVIYKGSTDSFCDEIDGQPLSGGALSVTDVTGNRVLIDVRP